MITGADGNCRAAPGTDLRSQRLRLRHDESVISGRSARWTDKQLERAARRAAGEALRPDDVLLDIEVGKLKRYRDNGTEKAVAPKAWANAVPLIRGLMTITYTRERLLFLSDGLGVYCPLVCIHRAHLLENQNQLFAFTLGDGALSIMEFERASRRASARPGSFIDLLVTARDAERAKLPAEKRESLERIDLVVRSHSLDELWARPPAPVSMEPDDVAALSGPERGDSAGDGIDEVAWNRLRALVTAASRRDAVGYAQTALWQPPDFGLAGHHRTGIYLLYLLWSRAKEVLQTGKPTTEQLHDLAVRTYPALHQILDRAPQEHLEEALRLAFQMPALEGGIKPGEFGVLAAATLGLLLDDPEQYLATIRPRVASWWDRNHASFVRQGLTE